jgi:indole-3-glycerol phosphate synthase
MERARQIPLVLEPIVSETLAQLNRDQSQVTSADLLHRCATLAPARSLAAALQQKTLALIAEFKPRSPSRGLLRADADPRVFAQAYRPAAAISVLCDRRFFGGGPELLAAFRALTDQPLLAKGFFVDPYQLAQVRALGADAALLIARLLPGDHLAAMVAESRQLGLEVLVETHTEREIAQALACGVRIIGVNARDLDTLQIDLARARELLALLPADRIRVAESGIEDLGELELLRQMHRRGQVDAVLMGTAFMTAADPQKTVASLGFL